MIKIFKADLPKDIKTIKNLPDFSPGEIIGVYKDSISVKTQDTFINIKELQQESRKRLSAKDFVAGSSIKAHTSFHNPKP